MKRFHEPSSEIRQGELELDKEFISDEITKEISKIDSMIENLESKNYDSVLEELKIQKTQPALQETTQEKGLLVLFQLNYLIQNFQVKPKIN